LKVRTREDVGSPQVASDFELTENQFEVHVDALKELDVCIELDSM
jgi:hypothetical protein